MAYYIIFLHILFICSTYGKSTKTDEDNQKGKHIDLNLYNTMIASISFVLTGNLISNFPQTGQLTFNH